MGFSLLCRNFFIVLNITRSESWFNKDEIADLDQNLPKEMNDFLTVGANEEGIIKRIDMRNGKNPQERSENADYAFIFISIVLLMISFISSNL